MSAVWTIISKLSGWITGAFVSLYETIVSYPKRSVIVASVLGYGIACFCGGIVAAQWHFGDRGSTLTPTEKKTPESLSDLLRETVPNRAYLADPPVKKKVDTVKVKVPKYITKRDTVYRWRDEIDGIVGDPFYSEPNVTVDVLLPDLDKGFLLLPLVNGNPTVSVSPDYTKVDAFSPEDGRNLTLEYEHPPDTFDLGSYLDVRYSHTIKSRLGLGLYSTFRNSIRLDVGVSLEPASKSVSPTVGLEVRKDLTEYW